MTTTRPGTIRGTIVGDVDAGVLLFTTGRDPEIDLVLVEADCIGTAAHVTMLSRMPVGARPITVHERERVVDALSGIIRAARAGKFTITAGDQDVHMAVERELTRRLGQTGKKVHTGRSRNDQVAVDLRLYARGQILAAIAETARLAGILVDTARRNREVPMVGRTHLQPAMPSSVGLWAAAYAESLLDDAGMLRNAYDINNSSPLGAAAGYGVPLPIDRELTARLLGFAAPCHNVMHAINSRGKCESVILFAMGQVMLSLSRLSTDLILFSMPEFGYFTLPREFCTGSSIMPQKRNPDVLELVRAKAATVLANAFTSAEIVRALPGGYNRDLQETKGLFMDGIAQTRASLRVLARLVPGVAVNRSALLAGFTPDVFATDRALELVAGGMPFRDAYDFVKKNPETAGRRDPWAVVAKKTHLGAPAGLDFTMMDRRVRAALSFAGKEERRCGAVISKLMGKKYCGNIMNGGRNSCP